jgi:myo-inositol 2-dehydrogenase/D-chiro-inositol 1-dehydrogenase
VSAAVLVGILGCGRAAERLHLPALARIPDARLTAAYDPGPERRELIARAAPGCRAFDSAEALLAARVVDAVIVASPPETHAELTVQALQAGTPALIDPPLTPSLDEAAWLRAEERKAKVPAMMGFNRRWWAPAEALRHKLGLAPEDAGATAETLLVSDRARGGDTGAADALHDRLVHHLDLLRFLMDREFAALTAQQDAGGLLTLAMTFQGGGTATCRARFGEEAEESVSVTTGGERFVIRAGSDRHSPPDGRGRLMWDAADAIRRRLRGGRDSLTESYERQLRGFIAVVRGDAPANPSTIDGVAAVQAVEAARLSLAHGGNEIVVPAAPSA